MKIYYYLFFCFALISCKNELDIYDIISADSHQEFTHNKTITDGKNYYEITIGENWKRELYVDQQQSRVYAADTTRNYKSSFLIDVTRFNDRIVLDSVFQQSIISQTNALNRSYIIKEGFINFKEQPAYAMFSFQKTDDAIQYFIQCYITYPGCYYLLSSTIHGNEDLNKNLLESVNVFNSFKILP